MKMLVQIDYLDGTTVTVTTRQVDVLRLERHAGQPFAKLAGVNDGGTSLLLEHIWHMAFTAARRDNPELPDGFDAWCDLVDEVTPVGSDEEPAGPLDRTP